MRRIAAITRYVRGNDAPLHHHFCILMYTLDSALYQGVQKHLAPSEVLQGPLSVGGGTATRDGCRKGLRSCSPVWMLTRRLPGDPADSAGRGGGGVFGGPGQPPPTHPPTSENFP